MPKAKLVSRGVAAIIAYMNSFPIRNRNGKITLCTPFKNQKGGHLYMEVQPHQIREMLEAFSPLDISMSDRIVLYRLHPCEYHLTFEGLEPINV